MKLSLSRLIGIVGTALCIIVFAFKPSFPTPDKILVFLTVLFMALGQAKEALKRFVPFVVLLLAYESFRGLVPNLNKHVNYTFLPAADRFLFFGHLPTRLLQNVLWHGHVMWYDFVFYGAYTLHFVLPFALAVLVWKLRDSDYWRVVATYLTVSFMGFLTFLIFPAAPPWMASEKGIIEPVARVSTSVWYAFGIHDFPSVYNKITPNPVAAVPSLHAAYSLLFALFITKLFKTNWRWLAWIYPVLIWIGTVYQGEHYAIDAIIGGLYALIAYFGVSYFWRNMLPSWRSSRMLSTKKTS